MKERLIYVDRLKGLAIFLVVLGHVIQYKSFDHEKNIIFNFIYSFHMPLFFFLSGYLAQKNTIIDTRHQFWGFIGKKCITLLVPFLVWPVFVKKYFFAGDTSISIISILGEIGNQFIHPSLWFLLSLFEIMIVFSVFFVVSKRFNKKNNYATDVISIVIIVFIIIACALLLNSYELIGFLLNLAFFFLGVFVAKYSFLRGLLMNKLLVFITALLFLVLIGFWHFNQLSLPLMKGLKVILSVSAIITLYNISQNIFLIPNFERFFQLMGKKTLEIYVTHFSILNLVPVFSFNESDFLNNSILLISISILLTIVLMYVCVMLAEIIKAIPLLNSFLYGKV